MSEVDLSGRADFRRLPDLAGRVLGGAVLYANDEFYADSHNLIAPSAPKHDPAFSSRGKVYDGWETRRRREPGSDCVIVRLARPAVVRGVNIDTTHFRGNYPPAASVEAVFRLGYPTVTELLAAPWSTLIDPTELDGDSPNVVAVSGPDRLVTHVRLSIHPDGGVARFRVYGEVVPDPRRLGGRVDLGALTAGGLVEACSNMFYAAPANVLAPGYAHVMSDGWETERRRDGGNDWVVVRLAAPAVLHHAVIDTSRFVGNAPGAAALCEPGTGRELLARTRVIPDTEQHFAIAAEEVVRSVRLDIYPDGGISRLRLYGAVPVEFHEQISQRWLDLLPLDVVAAIDRSEFFDSMLDPAFVARFDAALRADDELRAARYPAPPLGRQPVHTAYVPGDRFAADTVSTWGRQALAAMDQHGPLPGVAPDVEALVRAKLAAEPIEDLRVDFEDGYGGRNDAAEDGDVRAAASVVARGAPGFVGIRIKCLEAGLRRRAVRTLDLFLSELTANGPVPSGFRVTLPKVTSVRQVEAMMALCEALEATHGIDRLRFELQVETPQAILGADGTAALAPMLQAAAGRCVGLHYGTYDYSAALGISAGQQSLEHPVADHAKAVMQVAAAGTGVIVCDGSTNVLPVGDRAAVRRAWELHARLVGRALERGIYQGWDLHPAQLPTRYAATFTFYRKGFASAAERLRGYLEQVSGGVLDEPATARALAGFLVRAVRCGAISSAEVTAAVGVGFAELAGLAG